MFVLNPYHVGESVLASSDVMRRLDELQIAFANDNEERQRAITEELREQGVEADVRHTGAVSYKICGTDKVGELIHLRNAARASKNWAESDRIRDELAAMGIVLKDQQGWRDDLGGEAVIVRLPYMPKASTPAVMAGLVPAIHAGTLSNIGLVTSRLDVDARVKRGHDAAEPYRKIDGA